MTTFQVGATYTTRSICDYDCIYSVRILSRTAKTVTADLEGCGGRGVKTLRIGRAHDGAEMFRPIGNYSMAPVIRANK